MEVITDEIAERGLRRKALALWILSGALVAVTIGSILFYRNPWLVHRMDASQATTEVLGQIADSRSPYIKIEGMELTFTGYYKVNGSGTVCSYCYMGSVGYYYILTDIPARDKGALVEDSSLDANTLSDYTLTGQVVRKNEITEQLAEAENMTLEDYRNYYHMADVEIHDYDGDQERLRIYQLMLLVLAVGAVAAGAILWSESRLGTQIVSENL